MTDKTKVKIKSIFYALFYILFYPICGVFGVLKRCKGNDLLDFMDDWGYYLLGIFFWICGIGMAGLIVYGLKYHFIETIIPVGIFSAILFFMIVLPCIIHKIVNRK